MQEINLAEISEMQPFFDRLYEKKANLQANRPFHQSALQKIRENFTIEWTYHSNSIEGNTLSLRETQMILQEGVTIRGKSLREHFEAFNHEKAIQYLYNLINEDYILKGSDILSLHALVLRNIDDDFAGRIRNGGVRIIGANFTPPNAHKVSDLLDELIQFVNDNPLNLNDIVLASIFHHRLVWIHPFFDGNGRTVRLAMNLLLMRKGFPPAIILKNDRKKYFEALNQANKGNYQKLILLICQAIERSLNIYLNAVLDKGEDFKEISNLLEESQLAYSQEYISLLARKGKINAYKEGKNWFTSKESIEQYITHRKRVR